MTPNPQPTYKGSCLCKAIQYTITGTPLTTVLCHCTNCKKSSGSSFQANLFFKKDCLNFQSGQDKLSTYADAATDSGGIPHRSFCSVCGSNILSTNDSHDLVKDLVIITSGCLDGWPTGEGEKEFRPVQEYYCKRKVEWVRVLGETKEFEGMT
ncbi:DUF636 domain protein [Periconia macrospinosa]|uniref:DUF636 domain protein n=1 Tax=Periconia macrospinosa TaxID=97972 RepID=A0A2V1D9C4_9PLEO|nr:DUF636 domain protein [Periconia macrospinosa]